MMSVPREKISKGKQSFTEKVVDRLGRDRRGFQFLCLGNADKSC